MPLSSRKKKSSSYVTSHQLNISVPYYQILIVFWQGLYLQQDVKAATRYHFLLQYAWSLWNYKSKTNANHINAILLVLWCVCSTLIFRPFCHAFRISVNWVPFLSILKSSLFYFSCWVAICNCLSENGNICSRCLHSPSLR